MPRLDNMTHFHIETSSRDCDGSYERDHIWEIPPERDMRGELLWVACREARVTWNPKHTVTRSTTEDGYPLVVVDAQTEEGYHYERWEGCDDKSCNLNYRRYRDHSAEAAGY